MEDRVVLAKGVNFIYARQFIEAAYGEEMWTKIIRALPDAARQVWDQHLLPAESYPFAAFKAMAAALPTVVGKQKDAELSKIYEYIADQSLNKMYKIFFKLMNPSFVLKNYPTLWSRFFNSGTVDVPSAEKGRATLKFSLPAIFVDWLPPACLGFSRKAVEMSGGKDLSVREKDRHKLAEDSWLIEYELRWQE